jgi:hypothetical protein
MSSACVLHQWVAMPVRKAVWRARGGIRHRDAQQIRREGTHNFNVRTL